MYSPHNLDFLDVRLGDSPSRQIFFPDPGDGSLQVIKAISDNPHLSLSIIKQSDRGIPGYLVTAALRPDVSVGHLQGKITVTTNHPQNPIIDIPVVADIVSSMQAFPASLVFAPLKKGTSATKTIIVRAADSRLLDSVHAESSLSFLSTNVRTENKGMEYECTVTCDRNAPTGEFQGRITLQSAGSDSAQLIVPVCGLVRR
jgi:hypothetical protein